MRILHIYTQERCLVHYKVAMVSYNEITEILFVACFCDYAQCKQLIILAFYTC